MSWCRKTSCTRIASMPKQRSPTKKVANCRPAVSRPVAHLTGCTIRHRIWFSSVPAVHWIMRCDEPEIADPWHSPQASPSPSASVGHADAFSNFRAAVSDAWSGASASILSKVRDILRHSRAAIKPRDNRGSGTAFALESAAAVGFAQRETQLRLNVARQGDLRHSRFSALSCYL
jgi:hypothetical protein